MFERSLLDRYLRGAWQPAEAIVGLSPEEMNALPVPGTWSIRQIVLHLMDSDLIASDRMKRVIAEERPTLIGFDEAAFARNLYYDELDPGMACDLFAKNRLLTAEILRRLPVSAFNRVGIHNERGELTLANLVETYAGHLEHHLKFLHEKRRLLGKPL